MTPVTLEKELENARTYLELQNLRYKDKFDVIWDIDECTKGCKIIKIILQPILENAIYHGLKPLPDKGTIWISTNKKDAKTLQILVKDNGVGINRHKTETLNIKMKNSYIQDQDHIDLINVNQRIQLFFGNAYGLTIISDENQGTAVSLLLPYEI